MVEGIQLVLPHSHPTHVELDEEYVGVGVAVEELWVVLPGIMLVAVCTTVLSAYAIIAIPIPTKPYESPFVAFMLEMGGESVTSLV